MNEDETFFEFYIELSDIVNSCFDLNDLEKNKKMGSKVVRRILRSLSLREVYSRHKLLMFFFLWIKFCMLSFDEFQHNAFILALTTQNIVVYMQAEKRRKLGNFVTKIQQDEFKCGYWNRKEN